MKKEKPLEVKYVSEHQGKYYVKISDYNKLLNKYNKMKKELKEIEKWVDDKLKLKRKNKANEAK